MADVEKLLLTPKEKTELKRGRKPVKEQDRVEAMEAILNQLEKQSLEGKHIHFHFQNYLKVIIFPPGSF